MDFRVFFDRKTKIQFSILLFLIEKGAPVRKDELKEVGNISSFILEHSLEELTDLMSEMQMKMKILYQEETNTYSIKKYSQAELETLYYYFVKRSLFYKLILYLYHNSRYTIPILCQELCISEATVYRNIVHANQLLEEFGLVIKNGKIHGDDLQLCHFFFQFFWNSFSLSELEQLVSDYEILCFTDLLEKKLSMKMTRTTKIRICLWCRMLKVNALRKNQLSKTVFNLLEVFRLDPMFQRVKECYFLSLSYSAIFGTDYTAACIYLFLSASFPYAMQVRYELNEKGWPTYLDDVIQINEMVLKKIHTVFSTANTEPIKSHDFYSLYLLSQTHTAILYLKGKIIDYNSEFFFKHLPQNSIEIANHPFIETIVQSVEKDIEKKLDHTDRLYLSWVYSYVAMQVIQNNHEPISIGVHLSKTPLLTVIYIDQLKQIYGSLGNILIDIASASNHYDILIADDTLSTYDFSFDQFFCIQDITQTSQYSLQEILNATKRKETPCEL
ncbi:hypothetical protein EsVE80_17790 [Enterococcus saigonensis]|uniref:Mga helix-turn-helix domain-containing protein n=1 Tax=Enterococcus saigonensis TaxID=1805431 RepID=A0A679ILU8_9ENTE|nr:helix-turn-helix domain-containing protein [Enterococcus saigonensis]BCA86256.1 hypothetical protein EsVE80_17790 [Enterococcus saigonensis]